MTRQSAPESNGTASRAIYFKQIAFAGLLSAFVLTAGLAGAQTPSNSNAPVAFVYVSYTPHGGAANKIAAYAADVNGKLSLIPGSPFAANVSAMAANGKYLFASNLAGVYVASFRIQPNGALHWVNSTNVAQFEPSGCVYATPLVLDHTSATLYREELVGDLCEESEYQSFTIDKATGELEYIGKSGQQFLFNDPLTFSSNNKFAYGSRCINYRGEGYLDTFAGLVRQNDGLLDFGSITIPTPAAQNSGDQYCRSGAAADPTNHVAVSMQATNFDLDSTDGPNQLATYTADASGNLTTTSTWANMPATPIAYISDLGMSPSGKLLAVGGFGGLQMFHFNGSSPITHYTGLLTTDEIDQMFWDHSNHLYALSQVAGKLHVFTVTPTSAVEAPGSPYRISSPSDIIVQPR
jgi:hypothetical protein